MGSDDKLLKVANRSWYIRPERYQGEEAANGRINSNRGVSSETGKSFWALQSELGIMHK